MHRLERFSIRLRHTYLGEKATWLWRVLRPIYNFAVETSASSGLERIINGMDQLLVVPELRGITEVYEPDLWLRILSAVQPGDVFLDVGAYVGLYAIAAAKRIGRTGHVYAFEPDPENFNMLCRQISLNGLHGLVEARQAAVGDDDGTVSFASGRSVESHIVSKGEDGVPVQACRLDSVCPDFKVNIIKIDVEGFEEKVLQGAERLLSDEQRKPRVMFIEVHPYNWHLCGTTSDSLINRLTKSGYDVLDLKNQSVSKIDWYGEIIAIDRNEPLH